MDAQQLAFLTAEAVSNVLLFKTKKVTSPAAVLAAGIQHAVNSVMHLRAGARDPDVANLEIACDAALVFAEEWNALHPSELIHPRWMYTCVQSLLSHSLKPALIDALVADKPVGRLLTWVAEQQRPCLHPSYPSSSPSTIASTASLTALSSATEDHDDEDVVATVISRTKKPAKRTTVIADAPYVRPTATAAAAVVEAKTPWTESDIRLMIELRAQGFTHAETCTRLGRGKGAVENKYGRVVRETAWIPYVEACRARFSAVKKLRRKHLAAAVAAAPTTMERKRKGAPTAAAAAGGNGEEQEEEEGEVVLVGKKEEDEVEVKKKGRGDGDGTLESPVKRRRVLTVAEAAGLE